MGLNTRSIPVAFVVFVDALPARKPVGKSEHITMRHRTDGNLLDDFHKVQEGGETCSSSVSTGE